MQELLADYLNVLTLKGQVSGNLKPESRIRRDSSQDVTMAYCHYCGIARDTGTMLAIGGLPYCGQGCVTASDQTRPLGEKNDSEHR